jgi:hypothetical protein
MSRTALIRLAPTISHAIVNSEAERRTLYEDVKILPYLETPAVCIDHDDENRKIGEVLRLLKFEDTVLYPVVAPWLVASVRLFDNAPAWIKRGTGASISTKGGFESEMFGWPVKRHAILHEVSVCSATHTPVEPCARVLLIEDEKAARAPAPSARPTKAQREYAELHRRIDAALELDPNADIGLVINNMKTELGYGRFSLKTSPATPATSERGAGEVNTGNQKIRRYFGDAVTGIR